MKQAIREYTGSFNLNKLLELLGSFLGIAGALIMSFLSEYALVAWVLWTGSSLFLGWFAFKARLIPLLALQSVFLVINLSGIYNNI